MKDAELVLRYMALFHEGDRYEHPLKDFLASWGRTGIRAASAWTRSGGGLRPPAKR